jgi:NodT family efflux transporter outer membrane factor (OMF) lipoprotein
MSRHNLKLRPKLMSNRHVGQAKGAIAQLAAIVLFGTAVGGCSLIPAYHTPAAATPDAWATNTGPRAAVAVDRTWWQSFGDRELAALIERALTDSFTLQAAVARIEEARGAAEIAGAPQYPAVALQGTLDRTNGLSTSHTQALFVQASYEIDFWGKNRAVARSAQSLVHASAFDSETVVLTLTSAAADIYFQVLSLRERVRLAQEIADSARRILSLIGAQRSGGTASDLQIEQQRNAVLTFDAAVPALRQLLDQNVHALAVLVGAAPEGFAIPGSSSKEIAIPEIQADLPATVLRRRPDIQAAEARLVSANFDIGAARAAFYPSVTLTAAGGVAGSSLSNFFPATLLSEVTASLVQPLFEGGRLKGQLRFDRAHLIDLAATYRQTVVAALQDTEDALTATTRLKELEAIDAQAVEAARHAMDLADAQYRMGITDFLTVLTAERTLYQAEDTLLQVRLARLQAAIGLFRALGGGFDEQSVAAVLADAPAFPLLGTDRKSP